MRVTSDIITFSIEFVVALALILIACFEESIRFDMKIVLVFIGVLSLIASMITLSCLIIGIKGEQKND